ncbi:MAG TPA: MogA/MoaB family molybdenum cofactor biosynthesis protein [Methanotrichaceae archaeon]|nr:MogA/MoaB family molybdenum cofactor biosynthesis protein [Methanotrichaceae archaeon]HQF16261.1 MogA/MoaB family molybdenum cofactor biosynthesis protein [Methanotrichaceae archaeon]HQI90033.1 MogA/MoaB family molybdenum cofactor biosynthesis protein [Methanotrichaceae archaeon]HQJ27943.1 MogA/MoaB family molybdenum cofactor biosynthesis protein [Methanotrichaceae archaeon]
MIVHIITVSTSRYQKYGPAVHPDLAEDGSGQIILKMIEKANISWTYRLLPDGMELRSAVLELIDIGGDAVILCGGTGLAPLDLTIEAVEPLYEKAIPGFGEVFRMESQREVGTRAMLTRASAGLIRKTPVFCLPGSTGAARLGTALILAELDHILTHVRMN